MSRRPRPLMPSPRCSSSVGDGSFRKRLAAIAKISVLIIDDFAIAPIGSRERNDLLELLDDRVGARACIVTSQLPVSDWHDYIGDPTLADAILRPSRAPFASHPTGSQGIDAQARGGEGNRQGQGASPGLAVSQPQGKSKGASAADAADRVWSELAKSWLIVTDQSRKHQQRRRGGIAGHVPPEQLVNFAGIRNRPLQPIVRRRCEASPAETLAQSQLR